MSTTQRELARQRRSVAGLRRTDQLTAAALLLHGPIDVALTAIGRRVIGGGPGSPGDPEGNPVVRRLGERRWLLVKGLAIAGALVAWYIGRGSPWINLPLYALVALGVLLVLPNAALIALTLL